MPANIQDNVLGLDSGESGSDEPIVVNAEEGEESFVVVPSPNGEESEEEDMEAMMEKLRAESEAQLAAEKAAKPAERKRPLTKAEKKKAKKEREKAAKAAKAQKAAAKKAEKLSAQAATPVEPAAAAAAAPAPAPAEAVEEEDVDEEEEGLEAMMAKMRAEAEAAAAVQKANAPKRPLTKAEKKKAKKEREKAAKAEKAAAKKAKAEAERAAMLAKFGGEEAKKEAAEVPAEVPAAAAEAPAPAAEPAADAAPVQLTKKQLKKQRQKAAKAAKAKEEAEKKATAKPKKMTKAMQAIKARQEARKRAEELQAKQEAEMLAELARQEEEDRLAKLAAQEKAARVAAEKALAKKNAKRGPTAAQIAARKALDATRAAERAKRGDREKQRKIQKKNAALKKEQDLLRKKQAAEALLAQREQEAKDAREKELNDKIINGDENALLEAISEEYKAGCAAIDAEAAAAAAGSDSDELGDWDDSSDEEEEAKSEADGPEAKKAALKAKLIVARKATAQAVEDARVAAIEQAAQLEEKRLAEVDAQMAKNRKKLKKGRLGGRLDNARSPIVVVLGHVNTGKTKLLDNIRKTNVQDREVNGITQQIGATYLPIEVVSQKTAVLNKTLKKPLEFDLPGLLVIDTPGHASFSNLRSRGSGLCDIAILVIDIMHGLEPQTIESIKLLREKKTPFVVALNKIDCIYNWESTKDESFKTQYPKQSDMVKGLFEDRKNIVIAQLAEQGLNSCLYSENKDFRKWVSLCPTSAHTGEGIPDMLALITQLCQTMMAERITQKAYMQCAVLEVKKIPGLGTTVDCILVNGTIKESDIVVICGLNGPICTSIRSLLTTKGVRDMRTKGDYVHNKVLHGAISFKLVAPGLEDAIAGGSLLVKGPRDDIEDLKDDVMGDLQTILSRVDKHGQGVYVQSSTLGALEALLTFLEDMKIPVSGIALGPVRKADIIKASIMLNKRPEFATILAFDVPLSEDAKLESERMGVKIMTADVIYHLFDQFTAYMKEIRAARQAASAGLAIFPCILEILPQFIFSRKSPIVLGVKVIEGSIKLKTPLCIMADGDDTNTPLIIGEVGSMEKEQKEVSVAKKGDEVALKIVAQTGMSGKIMYGRQFTADNLIYSRITRASLDILKEEYADELKEDPETRKLLFQLKRKFQIM